MSRQSRNLWDLMPAEARSNTKMFAAYNVAFDLNLRSRAFDMKIDDLRNVCLDIFMSFLL